MLCTLCQGIDFKPWRELTRDEKITILICNQDYDEDDEDEALNEKNPDYESSLFHIHHPNLTTLQMSADDGCQFCYQMCYGAFKDVLLSRDNENDFEGMFLRLNTAMITPPRNEESCVRPLSVHLGQKHRRDIRLRKQNGNSVNDSFAKKALTSNTTTGSLTNLDLAAEWLHDCTEDHADCRLQHLAQSTLPSRVLDIGSLESPHTISLSIGEGRIGSYATLSYCWGKGMQLPPHVTTQDNIEARKQHIDALILPKTFSDAILVCRHLDIQFLWIDSMCILQGDADDWKEQSAQMAHIYSKATLNISAATGMDSDAGLFADRDPRETCPCPFNCRYIDGEGSTINASFLSCLEADYEKYGHLDTRGWTFQEMYLPTRTLRFSGRGMYWTCASRIASEFLPSGMSPSNHKSDFDKHIRRGRDGSISNFNTIRQKYNWWYRAVERYSRRNLTRQSDRLIAVSGLASLLGLEMEDEYLYGIWKADIVRGLTWRIDRNVSRDVGESTPSEYPLLLAPSWSWASRSGQSISYFEDALHVEYSENDTPNAEPSHPQHPFFDVLSLGWSPQNAIPSSLATSIYLRIRGLILRARHSKDHGGMITVLRPFAKRYFKYGGVPTYDEPVDEDDELYCLAISLEGLPENWTTKKEGTMPANEENGLANYEDLMSQREMLEFGLIFPGMTWCGDKFLHMEVEENQSFRCLILKKVGVEGIRFRRVGCAVVFGGDCFVEVIPDTLEII